MAVSSIRRARVLAFLLLAALALPVGASAKEESKIRTRLENLVGGGRHDETGSIRTHMADGDEGTYADLHLKVRRLLGDTEYLLMSDGTEIGRFTTGPEGEGSLMLDLLADGVDPRGTFMSVNDGSQDVLGAWLYGAVVDDMRRKRVKERTMLAPDETASPAGAAGASYRKLPSGMQRFVVRLKGVDAGDYDVCIDGNVEATVSTNADGNAKARFMARPTVGQGRSRGGNGIGRGPAHNRRHALDFDPRDKLIEIKPAGDSTVLFSGPMRAQIVACSAASSVLALGLDSTDPGQANATADVTTGNEDDCDLIFELDLAALLPGDYELRIDGATIDTVTVTDDGTGTGGATLLYDENPDSGENPLSFAYGAGTLVEVWDVNAGAVALSGTLP